MDSDGGGCCGCCSGIASFLLWCCNPRQPRRRSSGDGLRTYAAVEPPSQEAGPSGERTSPERRLLLPKGQPSSSSRAAETAALGLQHAEQQTDLSSALAKGRHRGFAADLPTHADTPRKGTKAASGVKQVPSGLSLASDEDDNCSTCLEGYDTENPKIWTQCGHHFHLACIYEWLNRKQTCPICGLPMSFDELL